MSKIDKIEQLQAMVKNDPQNVELRKQLAVLLTDFGFNEEALGHFLYLSKNMVADEGVFYNLGITYEKLRSFEKAKDAYLKAIALKENFLDAVYNLGLVYIELKEFDKAIDCFEKILVDDSQDSNTYFNLGLCYFKKGDLVQAIDYFQRTIDINDEDLYAHFYVGNIYKEFGDLDSAKEEFEKVLQLSPDYSWAYYNLAVIYNEQGNYELAKENLKKTIEMNPYDIEAYEILVRLLLKNGENDEALSVINDAFNECDETGDLDYIASMVYKALDNKVTSAEYLNRAIQNRKTLTVSINIVKNELANL